MLFVDLFQRYSYTRISVYYFRDCCRFRSFFKSTRNCRVGFIVWNFVLMEKDCWKPFSALTICSYEKEEKPFIFIFIRCFLEKNKFTNNFFFSWAESRGCISWKISGKIYLIYLLAYSEKIFSFLWIIATICLVHKKLKYSRGSSK